jgi:hypothetical protein
MRKSPGLATVSRWTREAAKLTAGRGPKTGQAAPAEAAPASTEAPAAEAAQAVDYEADPVVQEMIDNAPVALPLPAKIFVDRGLGVGDIPTAILLNCALGDLELRVDAKASAKSPKPRDRESRSRVLQEMGSPVRRGIDISKLRSIKDLQSIDEQRKLASDPAATPPEGTTSDRNERLELVRTPREETNRGKDPASRRYVRGVLHPHPWQLRAGAMIAIGCFFLIPLAVPAGILLLLSDTDRKDFGWVPWWFLVFPLLLPLFGLLYFLVAARGKCRICGQKLFVPHRCRRHIKAHHFPVLGYIVPTSLHLLVFQWFRCIFCGTPVRLKE